MLQEGEIVLELPYLGSEALIILALIIVLLTLLAGIIIRLLYRRTKKEPPVTEEEIKILLEQGTEAGTLEKAEQELVEKVFRLGDLRASALMTPRTQLVWLDIEDTEQHNLDSIADSGYSRFPAARGSLDEVVGIIYTRDLIKDLKDKKNINLEEHAREALFIPKSMKALQVLELFKQTGRHEALILDEYGGTMGMVTTHDIMERIVGEIPEQGEYPEERSVTQRTDGSWLIDGMLSIDEFKAMFEIEKLPDEERYNTLGGFVTACLGSIPAAADSFVCYGLNFEVVDMDRARVDKVLVSYEDSHKAPVNGKNVSVADVGA